MKENHFRWFVGTILLGALFHVPCMAQNVKKAVQPDTTKVVQSLGPSSVPGQTKKDESVAAKWLRQYFEGKGSLTERSGFSYGLDYFSSFQAATASLGDKTSFSGVFRLYGTLNLVGRKPGNIGALIFKAENRHAYGGYPSSQDLGFEVGYVGLTATPFSDIHWALTNFFWLQQLFDNRFAYVVGLVDASDYVHVHGLVDPWNDFNNLIFSSGATVPIPNQGLGAGFKVMFTPKLYLQAGVVDANGDPTDPLGSFESFFRTSEYFSTAEVGWIKSYANRFSDNVHLSYWYVDQRKRAATAEGWGLAFSFSRVYGKYWQTFVRAGYAHEGGALLEKSLEAGLGYNIPSTHDIIGMGVSWGRPSASTLGEELGDQYTVELYYRWRFQKVLAISPDIQLLFDPALNPGKNVIAVFGLRTRISL